MKRELDLIDQREVFIGKRLCKNLRHCHGRDDGDETMIFQRAKYRTDEISVGGNVLDIIRSGAVSARTDAAT